MADLKTRSMEFTSRALLYKPRNFNVEAKFHVKIEGIPDNEIIEQYIGMALHNYCHEQLTKVESILKRGDGLIDDHRKTIALLAKTNPKSAEAAQANLKKNIAGIEQAFQEQAKRIQTELSKQAEAVWKKQAEQNKEYLKYKIKVGVIAGVKFGVGALAAVVSTGVAVGTGVASGGSAVVISIGLVVGGIGTAFSLLASAITVLKEAGKSELTVRKNLEAALETLKNELRKANPQKPPAIIAFFKTNPAKKVESLLDDHKKLIVGLRQKADTVHNGVLKLINEQDKSIKLINDAKNKKQQVDPKVEAKLKELEGNVDRILKATEGKLDAMANAEKLHKDASAALDSARKGNLSGLGTLEKVLDKMNPAGLDFGDLGTTVGAIGNIVSAFSSIK
jgi:hypothetical protein